MNFAGTSRGAKSLDLQLGDLLLAKGAVSRSQLDQALDMHARTGRALAETLLDIGASTARDIGETLEKLYQVPFVDLLEAAPEPEAIALLPEEFARTRLVLPLRKVGTRLDVAIADPMDLDLLDEIALRTHCKVEPRLALARDIIRAVNQEYDARVRTAAAIQQLNLTEETTVHLTEQDVSLQVADAPLVRLVDSILQAAIGAQASDIHFEPQPDSLRVRFRIDGTLWEQTQIPRSQQAAVVSRLKLMADMDIGESRRSQDGRIAYNDHGRPFDLRASTLPTLYGEKMVLRILDKSAVQMPLERLGFLPHQLDAWRTLIHRPHGLVLVVGPTGSGKTTTLYASLNTINEPSLNITTIEDPVEYFVPGINQTQVNPKAGITFAAGLRSIVRQDPDVIMLGEIRDHETAEIAIQAALTGHLVLSTIHANSAAGTVARLVNMGVDPFLIASALSGVVSQRLVGHICSHCSQPYEPEPEILERLGLSPETAEGWDFRRGAGCRICLQRGYQGRIGIFEELVVNDRLRQLIMRNATASELEKSALESGMSPLGDSAWSAVRRGVTTVAEVARVVLFRENQ